MASRRTRCDASIRLRTFDGTRSVTAEPATALIAALRARVGVYVERPGDAGGASQPAESTPAASMPAASMPAARTPVPDIYRHALGDVEDV